MRVPQVNERVKEAPVQALRAMFAGIGSLLSVTDKMRNKPAAAPAPEAPAAEKTATQETPAATEATVASETVAETEATVAAEAAAAAEAPAAEAPAAAPAQTVETAEPAASAGAETDAALPLANYDDLSVASLRARLRNLSADQLATLIEYEKSHAGREDVVAMFERRVAKLAEG
jgi:hypothetical protein